LLDKVNDSATNDAKKDRFFVGELMRHVFGEENLGTHTLGGSQVMNEETGIIEIRNKFDPEKLELIYNALCTRVMAVGINRQERNMRKDRKYFNDYVKLEADKYKKRRLREERKQ
jgi:hypothetical protein